jgi:hypothetical protein
MSFLYFFNVSYRFNREFQVVRGETQMKGFSWIQIVYRTEKCRYFVNFDFFQFTIFYFDFFIIFAALLRTINSKFFSGAGPDGEIGRRASFRD